MEQWSIRPQWVVLPRSTNVLAENCANSSRIEQLNKTKNERSLQKIKMEIKLLKKRGWTAENIFFGVLNAEDRGRGEVLEVTVVFGEYIQCSASWLVFNRSFSVDIFLDFA